MEDPQRRRDTDEDSRFWATGMRFSMLAFEFVITIGLLGFIGNSVDEKYDSAPWGILGGLLAGMGVGLFIMVKQLEKINR